MTLPILDTLKYTLKLPSTGETIEFRPFLVKEEKNMLIAQESEDQEVITKAMLDLVEACTFGVCTPSKITTFDLEYIFVQLRARSVGEKSVVNVKCDSCDEYVEVEINLADIDMGVVDKKINNKVMLNDKVGIKLQWVKADEIQKLASKETDQSDMLMQGIVSMIECVFDETKVYPASETSREEMLKFVGSFSRKHIEQIQAFAESAPTPKYHICFKCSQGHETKKTLEGINSFFG